MELLKLKSDKIIIFNVSEKKVFNESISSKKTFCDESVESCVCPKKEHFKLDENSIMIGTLVKMKLRRKCSWHFLCEVTFKKLMSLRGPVL